MLCTRSWRLAGAAVLVAAVALGVTSPASAQLIAADSLNADVYDPLGLGTFRLDQTGSAANGRPVITPGWTDDGTGSPAPWTQGTGNLQWDVGSPGNLTLGNPAVSYDDASTGKGRFLGIAANSTVTFRRGFRVMDTFAPADTYYMSALVNPGGAYTNSGRRQHGLVGFVGPGWDEAGLTTGTSAEGTPYGLMFGFHGEQATSNPADAGQLDLVVRARGGDVNAPTMIDTVLVKGTTEATLDNITYLVMLKLEVNQSGATDRVTYWVSPSDLTSEATATTSALATGSFDTLAMDNNTRINRTQIAFSSYEGKNLFFDELRFAYDFESLRGALPVSGISGDYNNDGLVDAADYTTWRDNLGQAITLPNDATPGTVDSGDYTTWVANYGNGGPATAIPEPAACVTALAALAFGGLRRRSR
ncbi:MAG: hypothetical protein ACRCT8_18085 [Lacipirellulaceae bacterium]